MTVRIQRNPQAVWRAIKAYGTQERMATALGVEQTTVSAMGTGDRPVPWRLCIRIERDTRRIALERGNPALVVTCEELLPGVEWDVMFELAQFRLAKAAA